MTTAGDDVRLIDWRERFLFEWVVDWVQLLS